MKSRFLFLFYHLSIRAIEGGENFRNRFQKSRIPGIVIKLIDVERSED